MRYIALVWFLMLELGVARGMRNVSLDADRQYLEMKGAVTRLAVTV